MEDEMNTYNSLINNLEALELNRMKENIDKFLDMIAEGSKTALDALYELTEMEIGFRKEQAITGCVKVANFPYLKEINEFDFSFQPSIDQTLSKHFHNQCKRPSLPFYVSQNLCNSPNYKHHYLFATT